MESFFSFKSEAPIYTDYSERIYLLTDCRDDLRDNLIDYGLPDICVH